jgi:hypothetical protein
LKKNRKIKKHKFVAYFIILAFKKATQKFYLNTNKITMARKEAL